jgi:acetyltransferase-like isoleucine patch superfamily enzyme
MTFEIGEGCLIHPTAVINVEQGSLGPRSIIREGVIIEGNNIEIGAEAYFDIRARVGGGSCFDNTAKLYAGDWLHMGVDSHINIARGVYFGHEVGIGVGTKIFTHGAYLPIDAGFPVQWGPVIVGTRVWMPHAWVNPDVTIGTNVVIAAGSLVNSDIPSGCLAGGIPAKIIRAHNYPKKISQRQLEEIFRKIFLHTSSQYKEEEHSYVVTEDKEFVVDGATCFDLKGRKIYGDATMFSETLKNQLRRNGIRFRYYTNGKEYVPW